MEIDKSIIKAAADYALMHFQKGSRWGESYDTGKIRQEILESVIETSWAKALKAADAYTLHGSAPIAEAVVSACIHAGVDKNKVKMVHFSGWFTIEFPNLVYSIRKEISGYTARPEGVKTWREFQTVIGFKPEDFAQFLFAFDTLYPDILQAVGGVMTSVQEIILQRKKEYMIQQLQEVTVKEMIDQYLTPLKIRAGFSLENGIVHLSLRKGKKLEGHISVPFEKLLEKLQNSEGILKSLVNVKLEPEFRPPFWLL